MSNRKRLLNSRPDFTANTTVVIDGVEVPARTGESLIDAINRHTASACRKPVPQVCYHKQMGPIESCDT